jgi:hypothetical protein
MCLSFILSLLGWWITIAYKYKLTMRSVCLESTVCQEGWAMMSYLIIPNQNHWAGYSTHDIDHVFGPIMEQWNLSIMIEHYSIHSSVLITVDCAQINYLWCWSLPPPLSKHCRSKPIWDTHLPFIVYLTQGCSIQMVHWSNAHEDTGGEITLIQMSTVIPFDLDNQKRCEPFILCIRQA